MASASPTNPGVGVPRRVDTGPSTSPVAAEPPRASLWSHIIDRWRWTEETQDDYDARQW